MRSIETVLVGFGLLLIASGETQAEQACGVNDVLAHARLKGEVYGSHTAEHPLSDKLTFVLEPQAFGWTAKVRDVKGEDLAIMTPPLQMVDINPRTISGWHFRNADNSGPNTGEVNAPQTWRRIAFGPEAIDPTIAPEAMALGVPAVSEAAIRPRYGRGEITIEDYGLSDLIAGQRARMVYLKYSACLEWTPLTDEIYAEDTQPPAFPSPIKDRFATCGLRPVFVLSNHLGQGRAGSGASYLELDVDADGAADIAAPILRNADNKRAIAVCRADGRLDVLGLSGGYGEHLVAQYFDSIDWWRVHPSGPVGQGVAEGAPPTLKGDGITIGKDGSSSALLYWDGAAWSSYWQGD